MLRFMACLGVIITNFLLQSTLLQHIAIVNVKPNTAIIIIVCYAILRDDVEGAIFGFFTGLLLDIFYGEFLGVNAMLGLITGYLSAKPFKDYYKENIFLPVLLVAVSTLAYELVFYFAAFLFRGKLDLAYYLRKIILPETVYTAAVTIPFYKLIFLINKKVEENNLVRRKLF